MKKELQHFHYQSSEEEQQRIALINRGRPEASFRTSGFHSVTAIVLSVPSLLSVDLSSTLSLGKDEI